MSIRRTPRPETGYYLLDKRVSEDWRLSWPARAMLIFLLGKPDNWTVSVKHLMKQTEHSTGKATARDGVRTILKELQTVGYLIVDDARQDSGKFGGVDYVVLDAPPSGFPPAPWGEEGADSPAPANPSTVDEPKPDSPEPAKPSPADPHLIKNEFKQCTEKAVSIEKHTREAPPKPEPKAKPEPTAKPASQIPLPDWLPEQPWNDWLEMRKHIGKTPTQAAMKIAIDRLATLRESGQDPGDVLNQSTMNNWVGVFPLKADFIPGGSPAGGYNRQEALERRNALAAEQFINGEG
ncbi:MAG: hypothetical protein CMJ75_19000 [Planctomycetaceae bacterium]|nr:hypothetical protein [Planctomycetaceae bacterium]